MTERSKQNKKHEKVRMLYGHFYLSEFKAISNDQNSQSGGST